MIGATSGIGRAVAQKLVAEGWLVGITGRRADKLDELKASSLDKFVVSAFDATSEDALSRLDSLINELGGLDLLVFSSGTGDLNPGLAYDIEERTNRLNVTAFTAVIDHTYNYFLRQGGGHIAAITSVMGVRGSGSAPSYAASKAYQINYLEGLRQRSVKAKEGIVITDIRPGSVNTDMMKGEGHFWIATPEKAARTICRAISRKKSVQYVTPRWRIVGWLLRNMPRGVFNRM